MEGGFSLSIVFMKDKLLVAFILLHNVMELFSKVKLETGLDILFISLLDFLN